MNNPINKKIKFLLIFILVSGTLIIGLIGGLLYLAKDEPFPRDDDLWLSKIEIPEEEKNAFYYLQKAGEKLNLPEEKEKFELFSKMAEGKKWDSQFAKELIEKNKEAFGYFEKAIGSNYFIVPGTEDPKAVSIMTPLPPLRAPRYLPKLNSIRAIYLFQQKKEKEAFAVLVQTIKFGHLMQGSRNSLMYLVGSSAKEIGFLNLRNRIKETTLSPEVLKEYTKTLSNFEANKEGLKKVFKMEYALRINTKAKIEAALTGRLSEEELKELAFALGFELEEIPFLLRILFWRVPNYHYKPNQTQRLFVEYYRAAIENVDKNYNQMKLIELEPFVPPSEIKMLFTENVIGKMLRHMMIALWDSRDILKRKCEEDFSARGTKLLIAMRAYQIEKGKIPASLDELIPEYISEAPEDPFDGNPIRYSAEKKIIYSVGSNLKDEGGSEREDWRIMPDPTFKIEF